MKNINKLICGLTLATGVVTQAQAFSQETHKRIAIDAVNYMKANPSTTNYAKLLAGATKAGITIDQMAATLGQGAYDVDDFRIPIFVAQPQVAAKSHLFGAQVQVLLNIPLTGTSKIILKAQTYMVMTLGGYNYQKLTVWGAIDNMAASWLVGDYLDDGKGGLKGLVWR
jgi:hypothetical protein